MGCKCKSLKKMKQYFLYLKNKFTKKDDINHIVLASLQKSSKRLEVCNKCSHNEKNYCKINGIQILELVKYETQHCPIYKW